MAPPISEEEAIRQLSLRTAELRESLLRTRQALSAYSTTVLAHCDLGPTQFELNLLSSVVNEIVKYQNRMDAEARRR